jgi:hypothetical protein
MYAQTPAPLVRYYFAAFSALAVTAPPHLRCCSAAAVGQGLPSHLRNCAVASAAPSLVPSSPRPRRSDPASADACVPQRRRRCASVGLTAPPPLRHCAVASAGSPPSLPLPRHCRSGTALTPPVLCRRRRCATVRPARFLSAAVAASPSIGSNRRTSGAAPPLPLRLRRRRRSAPPSGGAHRRTSDTAPPRIRRSGLAAAPPVPQLSSEFLT